MALAYTVNPYKRHDLHSDGFTLPIRVGVPCGSSNWRCQWNQARVLLKNEWVSNIELWTINSTEILTITDMSSVPTEPQCTAWMASTMLLPSHLDLHVLQFFEDLSKNWSFTISTVTDICLTGMKIAPPQSTKISIEQQLRPPLRCHTHVSAAQSYRRAHCACAHKRR